jgi:hypothetical protein
MLVMHQAGAVELACSLNALWIVGPRSCVLCTIRALNMLQQQYGLWPESPVSACSTTAACPPPSPHYLCFSITYAQQSIHWQQVVVHAPFCASSGPGKAQGALLMLHYVK